MTTGVRSSYYVAVATHDQKLITLLELLAALHMQAGQKLSTLITCSSRDALDEVVCGLQDHALFTAFALHSDLTDAERNFQVSRFQRQLSAQADSTAPSTSSLPGADTGRGHEQGSGASDRMAPAQPSQARCLVMVATDVCLKALPKELAPLGVSLLVQYDLPSKKDQMLRRINAAFGSGRERRAIGRGMTGVPGRSEGGSTSSSSSTTGGGSNIVVDFVVAGELPQFRAVERFTLPGRILEMPVHVGEMLA